MYAPFFSVEMSSVTERGEMVRPRADMSFTEMLTGVASRTSLSPVFLRRRMPPDSSTSRTTVTVSFMTSPSGLVPYDSQ